MADRFGTQTEVMRTAAGHVEEVRGRIDAQLSALRGQLAPLEGAWRGEASLAFHQLMARWNTDARRINVALAAVGESVAAAGRDYRAVETENAAATTQITRALG